MVKRLENLVPGDYVFFIPENTAILITKEYEDGHRFTCAHAAISKFPESYRIATPEEIEDGKRRKQEFEEHMRKLSIEVLKIEMEEDDRPTISDEEFMKRLSEQKKKRNL